MGTTEAAWQKRATKRESVNQRLVDLVRVMLEEDPSDYAADAVTVLDVWRKSAAELLSAIEEQGRRG